MEPFTALVNYGNGRHDARVSATARADARHRPFATILAAAGAIQKPECWRTTVGLMTPAAGLFVAEGAIGLPLSKPRVHSVDILWLSLSCKRDTTS